MRMVAYLCPGEHWGYKNNALMLPLLTVNPILPCCPGESEDSGQHPVLIAQQEELCRSPQVEIGNGSHTGFLVVTHLLSQHHVALLGNCISPTGAGQDPEKHRRKTGKSPSTAH